MVTLNGHQTTKTLGTKAQTPTTTFGNDDRTDPERWRLLDERGRQTWHYMKSDEQAKEWPQTIADRHHLGLPLVRNLPF